MPESYDGQTIRSQYSRACEWPPKYSLNVQQKEGQCQYFALLGISLVDQQDASEFCQLLLFQTLEDPIMKCVEMVDPTFTHGTPQECTVGSQQAGEPPTSNYFSCLRLTGKRLHRDPSSANDSIVERKIASFIKTSSWEQFCFRLSWRLPKNYRLSFCSIFFAMFFRLIRRNLSC